MPLTIKEFYKTIEKPRSRKLTTAALYNTGSYYPAHHAWERDINRCSPQVSQQSLTQHRENNSPSVHMIIIIIICYIFIVNAYIFCCYLYVNHAINVFSFIFFKKDWKYCDEKYFQNIDFKIITHFHLFWISKLQRQTQCTNLLKYGAQMFIDAFSV